MVARLTLDQLIVVRIHVSQLRSVCVGGAASQEG